MRGLAKRDKRWLPRREFRLVEVKFGTERACLGRGERCGIAAGKCAVASEAFGEQGGGGFGREETAVDEQIVFARCAVRIAAREAHDGHALAHGELEAALRAVLKDAAAIADADESNNIGAALQLGELHEDVQFGGAIARSVIGRPGRIFDDGDGRRGER